MNKQGMFTHHKYCKVEDCPLCREYLEDIYPRKVVIEVTNGVATVNECPHDVEVEIIYLGDDIQTTMQKAGLNDLGLKDLGVDFK